MTRDASGELPAVEVRLEAERAEWQRQDQAIAAALHQAAEIATMSSSNEARMLALIALILERDGKGAGE